MGMKRAVLFAASPEAVLPDCAAELARDALVIAVDGGLTLCRSAGIEPDLLLGDFDSLMEPLPADIPILRHPVRKDDTDIMLAIKHGIACGCRDFTLFGCFGGRFDHTFANISAMLYLRKQGCTARMLDGAADMYPLWGTDRVEGDPVNGGKLSLFPLSEQISGVCERGLSYLLEDAVLENCFPLGVSNAFIGERWSVSIAEGAAVVIVTKKGE
ncbi:MAG: thiamine diphosphokinase [Oscillospiraceae bacterium]|nr:thiamine diphosphokinase [Oscillospiraceae bacterium]